MLYPEIRLHLREIRIQRQLSLREVEERTQHAITKSYLHQAEAGACDLTLRRLLWLAEAYQTAPWALAECPAWPVPQPCTCPCHDQREG